MQFVEVQPGEVMAALANAERRALYCQSLVSTFVQSARDAYPGVAAQMVTASSLVASLLEAGQLADERRAGVRGQIGALCHGDPSWGWWLASVAVWGVCRSYRHDEGPPRQDGPSMSLRCRWWLRRSG